MSKVQLQGNASGTGVFTIASPNSNTDRTLTLPNETGTILTSGGAIAGTTGTFSGIIQANGGGIQFPATQVPSANANTLDDYEEGTWTPTWSGGTLSSVTRANYVKIGRQVILSGNINFGSSASSSTSFVGGLPFASDTGNESTGSVMTNNITYPLSGSAIIYFFGGDPGFSIYISRSAGAWGAVTNSGAAGGIAIFTFTYLATN
jgi:hypothetical protein